MLFESCMSQLYSDTPVPDVFVTEYLPSMECTHVKVYLYCLFLSKHHKQAAAEELSKKLEMEPEKVKEALTCLENLGVISRRDHNSIVMVDLKEKEIRKLYRPKLTSSPEEAAFTSERNKKRNRVISAINNTFFQGVMSPSWYTDIDAWFDKYQFDEDVMYALFQHCYDHRGLAKQYLIKVADNWHSKEIRNSFDLDRYFMEYQKLKEVKTRILRKLKSGRNLTEDEEEYIEKWVMQFQYGLEIISLAFKEAVGRKNPFKSVHDILRAWYEKGLKTEEEVQAYLATRNQPRSDTRGAAKATSVPQHGNFEQRKYDKEYFDKLYSVYDEDQENR